MGTPVMTRQLYVCSNPNCDYRGQMLKEPRGNLAVAILLLLIGIIPGLIYMVVGMGWNIRCPQCRHRLESQVL